MKTKIFLVLIIIGLIAYILIPQKEPNTVEPVSNVIKKDSLIRDSIYVVNDSIETRIKYINKTYEKKVADILSADDSINLRIFSEYCENYKRSVKNN